MKRYDVEVYIYKTIVITTDAQDDEEAMEDAHRYMSSEFEDFEYEIQDIIEAGDD